MKNETFTPERIKAEADAFFEWDGEDRSLVTTTSCLLFAQHIAGLIQDRAAQPAPVVPEGYVLVPVEPTEAMRAAYEMSAIAPMGPISIYGYRAMLAAAPAQGQQGECQECERLRAMLDDWESDANLLEKERDEARAELSALKAQQEPVAWRVTGAGGLTVTPEYPKWADDDSRLLIESLYTAPQPAPSQDVAGLASSDPVAKAEFETRLRKEFESRWPKPKGVTWGAGINDYCVSEFAEGIALSYPDMWMAYKAGAMRTNQ